MKILSLVVCFLLVSINLKSQTPSASVKSPKFFEGTYKELYASQHLKKAGYSEFSFVDKNGKEMVFTSKDSAVLSLLAANVENFEAKNLNKKFRIKYYSYKPGEYSDGGLTAQNPINLIVTINQL